MSKDVSRIHSGKTPTRRHYILEWAEARNMRQTDIVKELDVDKGTVSRWFKGQLPQAAQQETLAALFQIEPEALLRHPDDDWMSRFFHGRSQEEKDRIKQAMELSWPLVQKRGQG